MPGERMERVQVYLDRAAALRDKAQAIRDPAARDELLRIAVAYEELAEAIQAEKGADR